MLTVKTATPEAAALIKTVIPGNENWVGLLYNDHGDPNVQEFEGHVVLTKQIGPTGGLQVFAHDILVKSSDETALLVLLRAAKRQAEEWRVDRIYLHSNTGDDPRIREFWEGRGSKEVFRMYELLL